MIDILNCSRNSAPHYWLDALAVAPLAKSHGTVCPVGELIYIAGGINQANVTVTDFSVYNVGTNTWRTLAPAPAPLRTSCLFHNAGKLYYVAGFNQLAQSYTKAVYVYDIATDKWSTSTATTPFNLFEAAGITLPDGSMYMFGGFNNATISPKNYKITIVGGNPVFTEIASYPLCIATSQPLYNGGNYIYLIGGSDVAGADSNGYSKRFIRYNIAENTFTALTSLKEEARTAHAAIWNNKVYAIFNHASSVLKRRMHVYDIALNTWTELGSVGGDIHALTTAVTVGDAMYMLLGYEASGRSNKASKFMKPL